MEILLSPASYFFTDHMPYGEGLICYNFVKQVSGTKFHVVSPNVNVNRLPNNVKLYKVKGYNNPFNPSVFKAINFASHNYRVSLSILRENNIDIIHHFLPVQYPRIVNFLLFNKSIMKKYPLIIGPVSFPTYWPRKGIDKIIDFLSKPLFGTCLEKADLIITQTKHTKDLVMNVLPEKNVILIPPAVDTEVFKSSSVTHNNGKVEILTVANLLQKKGIEYLIVAISYLKKDFPDIVLRIVGKGPYEAFLKSLSGRLNLLDNVIFEGYVHTEDLVQLYNNTMIYCSPSLVEPFGVVMLEAMACGKPIVATKTEGATEIIEHGIDGLLVEIANPKSMADALFNLINCPEFINTMGINAQRKVQQKYSWSINKKIYAINVYKALEG